jgi:hypothetical protein
MSIKPNSMRSILRAILADNTNPLGETFDGMQMATGLDRAQLSRVVHCLSKTGDIWLVNRGRHSRYFATEAQRDAAAPDVNALVDEIVKEVRAKNDERKSERDKARRAAKPKVVRSPKPPKPPKIVKLKPPKPCMPAPVTVKSRVTQANFKDQPAIIPPGVKVQRCPSGVDMRFRFDPPKGWVGEVSRHWLAERMHNNQRTEP